MTRISRTSRHDLYTAAQVRELDRLAIAGGIPGFELMQRAGEALLSALLERWPATRELIVLAGGGNNGGDGYVLAALAVRQGLGVTLFQLAAPDTLKGEAAEALVMAQNHDVAMQPFDVDAFAASCERAGSLGGVLIDAMLGTGVKGQLKPAIREVVDQVNASALPVLAVDVPSGLLSDTGMVAGAAIRADVTVTFIGLKQGMYTGQGPDYCGDIIFDRLSVPGDVYVGASVGPPASYKLGIQSVLPLLRPRPRAAHKGDCGNVLIVGGDHGFGGAVMMAAEAAARSGAGTVSLLTRSAHIAPMLARRPEVMVRAVEEADAADPEQLRAVMEPLLDKAAVAVIGPGLGRSSWSVNLLAALLHVHADSGLPLVLDADALVLLSDGAGGCGTSMIDRGLLQADKCIITPHPGEAAQLLGISVQEVQSDRFASVQALFSQWSRFALLKGAGSLICSPGESDRPHVDVCVEGNPGMASGGMGDVLSGIIAALLAQGMSLADSLRCAVAVHGESADLAAAEAGQRGLLATDLFPWCRELLNQGGR